MRWLGFLLIMIGSTAATLGCAPQPHPAAQPDEPAGIGFALRGQDTIIRIDFAPAPTTAPHHRLIADEICRLILGESTVECFPDGSFLLLGEDDGVELIEANPLWRLRVASADPETNKLLELYATLFLVSGSVDRLPDALADYLDDPGIHRAAVLALARQLVTDNGAQLPGLARGGSFIITFRLTDSGKDKLLDALQAAQDETGIEFVGQETVRHRTGADLRSGR